MYIRFIANIAGCRIKKLVCGDDSLVLVESMHANAFLLAHAAVYTKPGITGHGLGQVCKEIMVSKIHARFLSRDIIPLPDTTVYFYRDLFRTLYGSNFTKTKQLTPKQHSDIITYTLGLWAEANTIANLIYKLRLKMLGVPQITVKMTEQLKMGSWKYKLVDTKCEPHNHHNYVNSIIGDVAHLVEITASEMLLGAAEPK